MENILLVLNIIFALILVLLVLIQKSEGGALGIGVSQENFMFSRSAGNFMTKATAVVATLFIICSLALTIVSRGELTPTGSVLDTVELIKKYDPLIEKVKVALNDQKIERRCYFKTNGCTFISKRITRYKREPITQRQTLINSKVGTRCIDGSIT